MTEESTKPSFYKPELDTLRFFAFLGVFLFHALKLTPASLSRVHVPLPVSALLIGATRAGAYGVDLFFVLSAYLITELLAREKTRFGRVSIQSFYLRRVLRIWPLYYTFLFLAAAIPFFNPNHEFSLPYVLAFGAFVGNWAFFFWGWAGYVAVPLWTVSVEEQFYFAWPPLAARLSPRGMLWAGAALIALANVSRLWAMALHQGTQHIWTSTFAHLDALGAGIVLAVLLRGRQVVLGNTPRALLLLFGIALLVMRGSSVSIESEDLLQPLQTLAGYPAVMLACTAILIAFIDSQFRSTTLQYFGKISFGLYVYHMACLAIVSHYIGTGTGLGQSIRRLSVTLALTIAIAVISYEVLENPFLRLKRRFTRVPSRSDPING